ncbi:omega-3 fatty acid desaturase, endoplasmic reticulum-like [Malania oleifera]|uniref:omega-3 fatty acid desaturase, endoplasmic reticulum-like n=1 Tax=Malania oleifera TaxID=397392 RepID=UPI0025ADB87A|nr:omega-3 fatty acid desaturase, endoplasmic reticulum-like [Malania oleifera]
MSPPQGTISGDGDFGVNDDGGYYVRTDQKTVDGGDEEFDPAVPPPFRLGEIRAAIPKHCWVRDTWQSASYALRDFAAVFALGAAAVYINSWWFWPLYWAAQGTMLWALFVLGHDCAHGCFSENKLVNDVVGLLVLTPVLVPFQAWRISHKHHHQYHGNIDKDEAWVPVTESVYNNLDTVSRILRFTFPFSLFSWPYYLWHGSLGKCRSHFNPYSELFTPNERKDVMISTVWYTATVALLVWASFAFGLLLLLKVYTVPYMIFVMWLDLVTYLQHHGHDNQIPWYRGKEWNYLRGGLTTSDHDYGWFNKIHHDAGSHLIHHLFPQIPHYHAVEATRAAKPLLGKYYREPKKSGPFPFHLIGLIATSVSRDHFVSDTGDIVYYQTDPNLHKFPWARPK